MSMCHSDGSPRHPLVKAWPRLLVCLLAAVLVGCGGSASDDADATSVADEAGSPTVSDGSTTKVPTGGASGSGSDSSSGPATDAGLQLPAGDLPSTGDDGSGEDLPKSGGPTKPGGGGIEMPELSPAPANSSAIESAGQVQMASWSAIETHAKSTGKITVVDLWSTVCEPCVKEFPGLVRLSKAMPNDVACIGVSVDYDGRKTRQPESYSERVGLFLSAVGADFDNYLCNTPSDDVFAEVGLPSIPAVLIYDAEGKLVKQFVDAGETIGFSYEADVIPFVEKLAS